jgi:hypothetical protein
MRLKHIVTTKSKLIRQTTAVCMPLALTRGFEVSWNNFIARGVQIFQKCRSQFKILGARKATRIKQHYRRPTNIKCHRTKFSPPGDLAPDLCTSGYDSCNYLCLLFDADPLRISATTGYISTTSLLGVITLANCASLQSSDSLKYQF